MSHEIIPRISQNLIVNSLNINPSVAILGARQIGKTTLAKQISKLYPSVYLDLESPEDLLKLSDPLGFFELNSEKLIIIDEIQRYPKLFEILRGVIDKNRESGRNNKQFLLLGSASGELLNQTSESLAGRISYYTLSGLSPLEVPEGNKYLTRLWLQGGFPTSYLFEDSLNSMNWLEDLIRTYLEREIQQFGFRITTITLRRLWTMLAHLQGETINYSKIGANLEIDAKTVKRYVEILSELMLIRFVQPWYRNTKKRLVKSPRCYIRDSGIVHRLLGINDYESLVSNPIVGKSWEGFVVESIISSLGRLSECYFYRTSSGAEIDLIIKMPNSDIWAIEIKYGKSPKISSNYNKICAELGINKKFIIYGGEDEFPIGNETTMISLRLFLEKVRILQD